MRDNIRQWITYAQENEQSAKVLFESFLFNPCLQNIQQAVEKFLKALLLSRDIPIERTHSIRRLVDMVASVGIELSITDGEIDLLDSVYLPSKYPLQSAIPDFTPGKLTCEGCLSTLHSISEEILTLL